MYLISYDITSNKVRNKLAKTLEGYGRRVQYSVFECSISRERFNELYRKMVKLVEKDPDGNVRCYQLCGNCEQKLIMIGTAAPSSTISGEDVVVI